MRNGLLYAIFISVVSTALQPAARGETLSSADTRMIIEPGEAGISVRSLRGSPSGVEWIRQTEDSQRSATSISFIDAAYLNDRKPPIRWKLAKRTQSTLGDMSELTFIYSSDDPPLELRSTWKAVTGPGPIEHFLAITNGGKSDLLLPLQTTLAGELAGGQLEQWWVEKGAGTPTAVGVHRAKIEAGFASSLVSTPYARDNPREPVPWMAIEDTQRRQGWYVGVESSARVRIGLNASRPNEKGEVTLALNAGLEPADDFRTRLAPGETFSAPAVFIGCYQGDIDDGCNRLRHWVDAHLRPPTKDARYPLLVNNSWGSGMNIDESLCRRMVDESAGLGLEMFHIDAGWFRTVGDWRANPKKFPNGLAPIADYAHSKRMRFGLWVGWTQGGIETDAAHHVTLSLFDPAQSDWFPLGYPSNFKPSDFTGATVCLGDRRAADWCLDMLRQVVKENKLDMLEHDQTMIVDKCGRTDHLHTASRIDVAYRAAQGYNRVQDTLRAEFPDLLFEDCVNGGHQVDFGVIRRTHYVSITDTYDPLSNRRAFYDASFVLPPAMCECYIENHPGKTSANFLYMLRSGMMGWCTIMTDTTKWTPQQHEIARREFALYRQKLRPLIRYGDLYHISERPDGVHWDGMEYVDPERKTGVVFAFRGTTGEAEHTFVLKGLDPAATYRVSTEDSAKGESLQTGKSLMETGVKVQLGAPESTNLISLERIK